MAFDSYEFAGEKLTILKLDSEPELGAFQKRHHDVAIPADYQAGIVVKAEKDEKQLEGPKGYPVNVTVTFATNVLDSDKADTVAKLISARMYQEDPQFNESLAENMPDLQGAWLEPGTVTTREDRKKLRKRVIKFPFIIVLAP
jgi:hypothetical protein